MANVNVTVVGLGRLGSSFGLALKALNQRPDSKHQFNVTGNDRSTSVMKAASKAGAIDREVVALDLAVESADLVFLAGDYSTTKDVLEILGEALKPGAVVMDAAPLKLPSIQWAQKYFRRNKDGEYEAYLVGVTPIINPEHLGDPSDEPAAARADLFKDGVMIVSPAANCPGEAVQLITDLTELLSIKVHFLDPVEHDGMAAAMDGLPLLLQLGLFQSISGSPSWSDAQWLGNPSFFLATYRLLEQKPEALAAVVHHNRENTIRRLDAFMESLGALREILHMGDEEVLAENFDNAMHKYAEWQRSRMSNKWSTEPSDRAPEVRGGFSLNLFPSFVGKRNPPNKRK